MSIMLDEDIAINTNKKEFKNIICYLNHSTFGLFKFKIDEVVSISNNGKPSYHLASISYLFKKSNKNMFTIKKLFPKLFKFFKLEVTKHWKIVFDKPYYTTDYFSIFYPEDKIDLSLLSFSQKEARKNLKSELQIENTLKRLNLIKG